MPAVGIVSESFQIAGRLTRVVFDSEVGNISIVAAASGMATTLEQVVHGTATAMHQVVDGVLQVAATAPNDYDKVEFVLRVGADDALALAQVKLGVGNLELTGLRTGLHAEIGTGDVLVSEVIGNVAAEVGTGTGTFSAVRGNVTFATGVGHANLTAIVGDLDLAIGTGQVTGEDLAAASTTVRADTGSVSLAFTLPPGSVSAGTGMGGVTVTVPAGSGYRVTAATGLGKVSNSIPAGDAGTIDVTTKMGTIVLDVADA